MPFKIGDVVIDDSMDLKIGSDLVGTIKIGSDIVYQWVPPTITQDITLPVAAYQFVSSGSFQAKRWLINSSRPQIVAGIAGSSPRYLADFQFRLNSGARAVLISFDDAASGTDSGADLSSDFEMNGVITFSRSGRELVLDMSDFSDSDDPYIFNIPSSLNGAFDAIYRALPTSTVNTSGAIQLRLGSTGPAPPPTPTARHTFTITNVGGQGGYNRPGGQGTISDGTYSSPDGTERTIWHCRPVRGILNFSLGGANVPVAQFPGRIVAKSGANTVVLAQPSSVRNIAGNTATRADYTVSSGTLTDVFASGNNITVELWDS